MTLLVTLYCFTICLTYDRADFTYKSLRNHVQKYYVFSSQGVRTHITHLVCLRYWRVMIMQSVLDCCELDRYCSDHANHQHLVLLGAMNALVHNQGHTNSELKLD